MDGELGMSQARPGAAGAAAGSSRPSSKLKILYHHRTASKDGQAVHIEELIAAFRRLGHEVVVVGPRWSERQSFGSESRLVGLLRRYLPRAAFEALEFAYTLVAYRNLRRAYRAHRPDVFYERYNLFLLAGAWLRRRTGIPYILEVNAPLFDERQRFGGLRLRRLAAWCQKTAWQSADAVLPVTGVLAGYVRRDGVPESRITVIQNGINRAAFLGPVDGSEVRRRYGLEGRLVLGFTGFMREWHGLGSVVELLAQADPALDLHLLVVGDGPGRQDLTDQAARLGVAERIHVAGLVDRDAIPAHVAAFDIALQPAATAYASPLKIFEYMALGRAIVAPRQANIEEILCDGETALLFAPGDGADFRAQVERLCTDVDLRRRLGAAARRTIEDNDMTWDGNARRVEALFRDMLRARADRTQVRRN